MSNLDNIDVFVKVVQCGSFTGAARLLQMPVTTVSGKIRSLEARLGITLLHRTTRRLSVTDAGRTYFEHCSKAVEEVAEAERALQSSQSEPEGILRITAAPDVGYSILPPLIERYLRKYPKTRVELLLTNQFVDLVGESVDIAIRPGELKDSTMMVRKFRESEAYFWSTPAYIKKHGRPGSPGELEKHQLIGFQPFGDTFKITDGRKSRKIKMPTRVIVDDFMAVKIFVARGDGVAFLPPFLCAEEEASGRFVRVLPDWRLDLGSSTTGRLSLVYPRQKHLPPKVMAFIEIALT